MLERLKTIWASLFALYKTQKNVIPLEKNSGKMQDWEKSLRFLKYIFEAFPKTSTSPNQLLPKGKTLMRDRYFSRKLFIPMFGLSKFRVSRRELYGF